VASINERYYEAPEEFLMLPKC